MKGINTPGKPWKAEALPPFPPEGAAYSTLLSRHSLGSRTIKMLPLLSVCGESSPLLHIKLLESLGDDGCAGKVASDVESGAAHVQNSIDSQDHRISTRCG